MEKDVHSSTDSEGDDDRKYINQQWAWDERQLELIQLDSDTIKREYRKILCQQAILKNDDKQLLYVKDAGKWPEDNRIVYKYILEKLVIN